MGLATSAWHGSLGQAGPAADPAAAALARFESTCDTIGAGTPPLRWPRRLPRGDTATAIEHAESALSAFRSMGSDFGEALALHALGWQALDLPLWLHRSRVGLDSAMAVAAGHD